MYSIAVYNSKELLNSDYELQLIDDFKHEDNDYNMHTACYKRLSKIDRAISNLKFERDILFDIYNSLDSTIKFDND